MILKLKIQPVLSTTLHRWTAQNHAAAPPRLHVTKALTELLLDFCLCLSGNSFQTDLKSLSVFFWLIKKILNEMSFVCLQFSFVKVIFFVLTHLTLTLHLPCLLHQSNLCTTFLKPEINTKSSKGSQHYINVRSAIMIILKLRVKISLTF